MVQTDISRDTLRLSVLYFTGVAASIIPIPLPESGNKANRCMESHES